MNDAYQVERFNATVEVGTKVRYWPGVMDSGAIPDTGVTTSEAYLLGGHTPVVMIDTATGPIALTHVWHGCSRRRVSPKHIDLMEHEHEALVAYLANVHDADALAKLMLAHEKLMGYRRREGLL